MVKKVLLGIYFSALAIAAGLYALSFFPDEEKHLATPPEHSASTFLSRQGTGVLHAKLNLEIPDLLNLVKENLNIPKKIESLTDPYCPYNRDRCYDSFFTLELLADDISLGPIIDNQVYINIPVYMEGEWLSVGDNDQPEHSKYLYAHVTLFQKITLDILPDWCFSANEDIKMQWHEGRIVDAAEGYSFDLATPIHKKLIPHIQALTPLIVDTMDCQQIQQGMKTLQAGANKLDPQSNRELSWSPDNIEFHGLSLAKDSIEYRFSVEGKVGKISRQKQPQAPETKSTPERSDFFRVYQATSLPLSPVKEILEQELTSQTHNIMTRYGHFEARYSEVRLYPSRNQLVIGLKVEYNNSEDWGRGAGWLYLLTNPILDVNNKLKLELAAYPDDLFKGHELLLRETVEPLLASVSLGSIQHFIQENRLYYQQVLGELLPSHKIETGLIESDLASTTVTDDEIILQLSFQSPQARMKL